MDYVDFYQICTPNSPSIICYVTMVQEVCTNTVNLTIYTSEEYICVSSSF